jgi:O-antigen/teichoic acid export membrane protein
VTGTGETHQERINRELMELLTELRVALPGVQFLFAFLLVVPFSQGVDDLTDFQRDVYLVALLAAAIATALLIAPAAQHRVLFRKRDKDALLRRSNHSAFAGLVVLALAVCSSLLLVVDVLFDRALAWTVSAVVAALLTWWWLAVPLWFRSRREDEGSGTKEP